ncbi:MAG: hypothetical protein WDM85_14970 [Caulobacteraceae bacterium]
MINPHAVKRASRLTLIPCLAGLASISLPANAAPAAAEKAQPPVEAVKVQSLIVTAKPLPYAMQPGAVVGDITPEIQLDPSDIQSYGVSTVTELLNELAPQTRSDRGRGQQAPVVLLNGRRISSLNEVQNIPTEAILRIDILPEEVALKYGYTADQRVINFVLKPLFRAFTAEAVGGTTTEGGDENGQAELDRFKVDRDTRLNLDLKYQISAGLTDAQRGLAGATNGPPFSLAGNVVSQTPGAQIDPAFSALVGQPATVAGVPAGVAADQRLTLAEFAPQAGVANVTDTASDYSLAPASQALTANAVVARPFVAGINATLNVTLGATHSTSLQGLPGLSLRVPAGDPFSPFASPVTVDRYVAGQGPLEQDIQGLDRPRRHDAQPRPGLLAGVSDRRLQPRRRDDQDRGRAGRIRPASVARPGVADAESVWAVAGQSAVAAAPQHRRCDHRWRATSSCWATARCSSCRPARSTSAPRSAMRRRWRTPPRATWAPSRPRVWPATTPRRC